MNDNRSGGEGLQRKLSPLNVWALALGSIIGWGAFVMPANTFLPNAGPLGTLIAMAAGAIIMVVIALNYSYMINHFPVAGGEGRDEVQHVQHGLRFFVRVVPGPLLSCHRALECYCFGAHRP